jgi:peptidoglycan hydrolase-like protein with peptidoglycan-binding domain
LLALSRNQFCKGLLAMATILFAACGQASAVQSKGSPPVKQGASTATKPAAKPATKKTAPARKPAASRSRPQNTPSADRIREIQTALKQAGFYTAEPNGKWDSASIDAMKRFQQAKGLNPTGKLDARSLQKLGLGSPVAGQSAPRPANAERETSAASPDNR